MNEMSQTIVKGSTAIHIPYRQTGFFSKIVIDYLNGDEKLKPFYNYAPDVAGIKQAVKDRKDFNYDRKLLVEELKNQYQGLNVSAKLAHHLELLLLPNTFTITTAHQPNIFTGPLYFVYKILHAIKLAESLQQELSDYNFVPVFYMGSEDADLEELGSVTINGRKYQWQTKQTGAVGRMKVDKAFIQLMNELHGQLAVQPHGEEILTLFRICYKEGKTIQQATLELVNALFGEYGLVVLIPDNANLKRPFIPVVERELKEQFSHNIVERTLSDLSKYYKEQAGGRDINLFYLLDDKRERIELRNSKFEVQSLGLQFDEADILNELKQHPERFSANVILRGIFQEMILPNVAFIGGGAEIAYWLELKNVFEVAKVPYPVLVIRNSFLILTREQQELFQSLGFLIEDIFKSERELINQYTLRESHHQLSLSEEKGELNSFYQKLHDTLLSLDPTLSEHVNALQAKSLKKVDALEKKMLRSAKRKFEAEQRKIHKIKTLLFPNDGLQERVENIAGFYAKEGAGVINKMYEDSLALEQAFTIVTY